MTVAWAWTLLSTSDPDGIPYCDLLALYREFDTFLWFEVSGEGSSKPFRVWLAFD
jgi:hypothetical protein